MATSLGNLASVPYAQGDYALARSLYEESLQIHRELGNRQGIASTLNNQGEVACAQADYAFARSLYEESLQLHSALGDREGIIIALESFACLNVREAKPREAARLWGAVEQLRAGIDTIVLPNDKDEKERNMASVRAALGAKEFAGVWAEGRTLTLEQAIAYALGNSH